MSKSFEMLPAGYKAGKLFSQIPTNGDGDFVVDRNSKARVIDVNGDDVEILEDVPCFDYRGDYVEPIDNSYYSFDGVNDYVTLPSPVVSAVTNPFSSIIKFKIGSDVTTLQCLFSKNLNATNRLGLGIKSGVFIFSSYTTFYNSVNFAVTENTEYTIAVTKPSTHTGQKHIYVNGVLVATTSVENVSSGAILGSVLGRDTGTFYPFLGEIYTCETYNYEITAQEVLDRYNGLPIPEKYKGATNISVGAGSLNIGETYVIEFVGTTDFTVAGASSNTVGEVFECTAIAPGSGTAFKAGNTLNLDKGKTDAILYDLDHDIQGTVNGAVLNDSTDFGNNTYPLETCPSLLTQSEDITNRFQDSANPVSQTINGLTVGVPQTLSCKGGGVITIVENGGSLLGGAATEVYPFTFTPTHTSVDITLSAGHSLEHVNFTDTPYAVNHILTPNGGIATRLKDEITGGGSVSDFDPNEGVFVVNTKAFDISGSDRAISISDGTSGNQVRIEYLDSDNLIKFRTVSNSVGEANLITTIDTTKENVVVGVWSNNYAALWVNGVKISESNNNTPLALNTLSLTDGQGAKFYGGKTKYIEYYKTIQSAIDNGIITS